MAVFSPLFIVVVILLAAGALAVFIAWEFRTARERREGGFSGRS